MKFTGVISDVSLGMDGMPRVTITVNEKTDFLGSVDDLKDKKLSVELKQYRERRSLDANAYCWVLMGKIAEATGRTSVEVYREEIQNIGGNFDVFCCKETAVDNLRKAWSERGIGWITDTMPSKLKGCVNVVLYYGSSVYDTKQMSHLIEIVVQDAKELGIQTETPEEIERMISLWGEA